MCTVHSFPHNIDHCLTFARSEFEGFMEKAPAEANAFLADPTKYITAIRQVHAPAWSSSAPICLLHDLARMSSCMAFCVHLQQSDGHDVLQYVYVALHGPAPRAADLSTELAMMQPCDDGRAW